MCGRRCFIFVLIIFSIVKENYAEISTESEDENSINPELYGSCDEIDPNLISELESITVTNKITNLKLTKIEAKLETLEESISKIIDMKLQSFAKNFLKFFNEANNNLKYKEIDLELSSTKNNILEAIKTKTEQRIEDAPREQKNDPFISLGSNQNSTKQLKPEATEICRRPENCAELLRNNQSPEGIYHLQVRGVSPFGVYCMPDRKNNESSAWTIIQRRRNGEENFYRNWREYRNGFGDLSNDFWLGLDRIYALTSKQHYELLIDLEDWEGEKRHAKYDYFTISNEKKGYSLILGEYSGNAVDSFSRYSNRKFSTWDNDDGKCAEKSRGGWWYGEYFCHHSNLNGLYNSTVEGEGINWYPWHGYKYSLKYVQMAIRPKEFNKKN